MFIKKSNRVIHPIRNRTRTAFAISNEIHWTNHAKAKMRFYKLSEQRVKRVLNSPKRTEDGVAPGTAAFMQIAGSKKHPCEIWVMTEKNKIKRKIISAWRYPGTTKPRSEIAFNFIKNAYDEFKLSEN